MVKVIIADDEPFIRECLVHGMDWEKNGFEVVGICKNGREVVQKLEEEAADVVITDIKMPYMNGIELLTHIHDHCPGVHTLVISGYEEFDYAKHAIDCNADGYLLKPIDPDELMEKMRGIAEEIRRERKERARRDDPHYLLQCAMNGEDVYDDWNEFGSMISELEEQFFAVALIHMWREPDAEPAFAALKSIEDPREGICFFPRVLQNSMFIVWSGNERLCREKLEQTVERASRTLEDRKIAEYHIAASHVRGGLESLAWLLEDSGRTMLLRSVVRSEKVFYSWNRYKVEYRPFREDIAAIVQAMRRRSKEQAEMILDAIFELFAREDCSFHDIQMFSENLLYTMSEDEAFSEIADRNEDDSNALMKIFLAGGIAELHAALKAIIGCAITRPRAPEGTVENLVNEAKTFIRDNISDADLSLNRIAKHLNHNPSYFSYVFSNACGETLSHYITVARIERAKALLSGTDQRIVEICEATGYQNANYFGKIFKRETGYTPKVYRQIHRSPGYPLQPFQED